MTEWLFPLTDIKIKSLEKQIYELELLEKLQAFYEPDEETRMFIRERKADLESLRTEKAVEVFSQS